MTLGSDLGLDSLGRVELLSAVESHLGVYLDESQVDEETTVGRLQRLLDESAANPVMSRFPAWGMRWWCRMARGFLQRTMLFPGGAGSLPPECSRDRKGCGTLRAPCCSRPTITLDWTTR